MFGPHGYKITKFFEGLGISLLEVDLKHLLIFTPRTIATTDLQDIFEFSRWKEGYSFC